MSRIARFKRRNQGESRMLHDAVLGIIPRDQLPNVLTVIHRSGLGPQARVLDPDRGDLTGQLTRAGILDPPLLNVAPESEMLLVVFAAGRMSVIVEAMERFGGREIQTLDRRTSLVMPASPQRPANRRGRKPYRPTTPSQHANTPGIE